MSSAPQDLSRRLREWSVAALCRSTDPLDAGWDGILYASQTLQGRYDSVADDVDALRHGLRPGYYRQRLRQRRLASEGLARMISGRPLCSEAPTAFVLDGRRYASVACFYEALKFDEEAVREEVASGTGSMRPRGPRRPTFDYRGESIRVDSREHGALIGRATEAKAQAHPEVRIALQATGEARLHMGERFGTPQALGRYMPFALMIARARLRR